MKKETKTRRSFTLIELMLVVGIVAVLAGAMIPMIISARQKARVAKVLLLVDTFKTAVQRFYADTGRLPTEASSSTNPWVHELFENSANPGFRWPNPPQGQPIPGWDGSYISHRISQKDNPYSDLIGVGWSIPAPFNVGIVNLYLRNVPVNDAYAINTALDTNEPGAWGSTGTVRYFGPGKQLIINFISIKMD